MSRLQIAFLLYIVLAGIAGLSLTGDLRLAVLILFAGLAVKTWIGHQKAAGTGLRSEGGTEETEERGSTNKTDGE